MPLVKVHGPENSADLMTKHLGAEMIRKLITRMSLSFRTGRAEKAAQLQSVKERAIVMKDQYQDRKGVDKWISRGANRKWIRKHCTPRLSMFTPCRTARGPAHPDKLKGQRITEGINQDGSRFLEVDDWRDWRRAHKVRKQPWTGTTTFIIRDITWADCEARAVSMGEIDKTDGKAEFAQGRHE